MNRTTDITNFTEHRKNLRDHFDQVRATGRPLYVTRNGETDAVVLSAKTYDELAEKAELAESLRTPDKSMEDVRATRGRGLADAVRAIADELGLELSQR